MKYFKIPIAHDRLKEIRKAFSKRNKKKQENITVECILLACVDRICFNSHQMSAPVEEGGTVRSWFLK